METETYQNQKRWDDIPRAEVAVNESCVRDEVLVLVAFLVADDEGALL